MSTFLYVQIKKVRTKKEGLRQWAIWAVLRPRRASSSTAQGRCWPQGLPRNDQFSTGFIRFSDQAESHAANSENPNGFFIILECILRNCVQKSNDSSGFIGFFDCVLLMLGIPIFLMVFHVLRMSRNGIAQ